MTDLPSALPQGGPMDSGLNPIDECPAEFDTEEGQHQVASDIDADPKVGNNVIRLPPPSDIVTNPQPAQEQTSPAPKPIIKPKPRPKPFSDTSTPLIMPGISQLPLHPPSQIVGTPFALTTTPFEYPFPDTRSPTSGSSSSSTTPNNNPSASFSPSSSPPQSHHSPIPYSPFSSGTSFTLSHSRTPPPTSIHYIPSYPYNHHHYSPPHLPEFPTNFAHPKMKQVQPPPPPPGLAKKKHRWSLGLLGRRRSSASGGSAEGSDGSSSGLLTLAAIESHSRGTSLDSATAKLPGGDPARTTALLEESSTTTTVSP
ncbi:hypothetical protein BDN72DRAFT_854873 [Pluteus cervinus]|uniref:Uncharacterized protein n=1 Tax=Pluteus cervinus TaxID=181527 RepID=A0ACD3B5M8_9AGAR|nr:hypothetical protein BDN72DRAFT_854873 [Pluteus cervinus]